MTLETDEQALTQALFLALTAPEGSEERAAQVLEMAEALAAGLDEDTVEKCKAAALEQAEAIWERYGEEE